MNKDEEQATATQAAPDFDSIKQVNPYGQEYWSARDLMPLLGYDRWERFEGAIKRASLACKNSGNVVADHFPTSAKMVTLGSGAQRKVKNYNLSRFACYLTAQNGEPSKPEIAAAQVYFAVAARSNELRHLAEIQNQRVELREEHIDRTKALNETAAQAGVQSRNFGVFHDAGYKGLYGGLGAKQIKVRKGIPAKEDLMDRAGTSELAANVFRLDLARQRIAHEGIIGESNVTKAHHEVGEIVRRAIAEAGATLPEDLPAEQSIKPLIEERKRGKKKAVQPKEQSKLFDEPKDENEAGN